MKISRTQMTLWGVFGFVVAGSFVALPAQAQLADLTKAVTKTAGKLADTLTGATEVSATVVAAPNASTDKSARVMLLDKQTNRRQNLVMIAGTTQIVGSLQIKLTKCLPDYGAVLGQDVAWLEIDESAEGNGRTAPWFAGWMFNTYPEISTLDHPRYDVQLQGCGVKARAVVKASGSAPIVDSAPIGDTESGGDNADPFYVPGVEKGVSATTAAPVAETPVATPAAEEPVVDTEAPAVEETPVEQPAVVEPQAGAAPATQDDLHKMMDSGQY